MGRFAPVALMSAVLLLCGCTAARGPTVTLSTSTDQPPSLIVNGLADATLNSFDTFIPERRQALLQVHVADAPPTAPNISGEIISQCHQCSAPCDAHHNCDNTACHLLFIQCAACREKYDGCCSAACRDVKNLPLEQQKQLGVAQSRRDELFNNSRKRRARTFDLHGE